MGNMHCAIAYRLLADDEINFLETLSVSQRATVRKAFVDIILGTDMAVHGAKKKKIEALIEEKGPKVGNWESAVPALEAVVHTADLSNVCRPCKVALTWTDR